MTAPLRKLTPADNRTVQWLRQQEDQIGAMVEEFVRVPTENPPGKNLRICAELLERHIRETGLECERFENLEAARNGYDPPVSLMAGYGRGERTLYFHGHYDVVPAQSAEQFKSFRREHFLFGRGSCDMKGGIAAMLFAIRALKESAARLNGQICLSLVPDEETGGGRGSAWLARRGILGRQGIGMLLPEPTSGVIWNANRGAISLRVRVFGKSAHVGLQHQGENAFERALRVVEQLQKLKHAVEKHTTSVNIGAEQSRNSILMLGGESGGGTNFNVVPETCWFTVDRRVNPEEDLTEEKGKLLGVLEDCKTSGIPLEWEVLQEGDSTSCREDEALGKALAQSVVKVTGEVPRFEMCPGLLEIRFYASKGIPAYAYGPGLLSVAHGPNEYVDLRKVIEVAAVYALTAMEVLKD